MSTPSLSYRFGEAPRNRHSGIPACGTTTGPKPSLARTYGIMNLQHRTLG
jgi:hypothetical protein